MYATVQANDYGEVSGAVTSDTTVYPEALCATDTLTLWVYQSARARDACHECGRISTQILCAAIDEDGGCY